MQFPRKAFKNNLDFSALWQERRMAYDYIYKTDCILCFATLFQ